MDIEQIAKIIKQNGGNTYLVGGAVRDAILNKSIKDEDYCVTGITAEEFMKLFPQAHIKVLLPSGSRLPDPVLWNKAG